MTGQQRDLDKAITKLKSHDQSGQGIVEVVAYGNSAIQPLRQLLFQREPSGLFETRCRAVDALSALRANRILIEYLSAEHLAIDPVERMGDDAVINCAAWAVARKGDEHVFALLLRLAQRPHLNGVIGALGTFGRMEAIPALILALEEDTSRKVAEYMLRRMGRKARAPLLASANERRPSPDRESASSLRRRRSSLMLLADVGVPSESRAEIRCLMRDDDVKIAFLACKLCLLYAAPDERHDALSRLVGLLPSSDWVLRQEIESCLGSAAPRDKSLPNRRHRLPNSSG
jgi:hypothetical protein